MHGVHHQTSVVDIHSLDASKRKRNLHSVSYLKKNTRPIIGKVLVSSAMLFDQMSTSYGVHFCPHAGGNMLCCFGGYMPVLLTMTVGTRTGSSWSRTWTFRNIHHFFSERVVNRWNKLPSYTVDAKSVNQFKSALQKLRTTQIGFFLDVSTSA